MSWGITIGSIVGSIGVSMVLYLRERKKQYVPRSLWGFVSDKYIQGHHFHFTLLSLETSHPTHFVLPCNQMGQVLKTGDFIHVEYEKIPAFFEKPIFVKQLEIIN